MPNFTWESRCQTYHLSILTFWWELLHMSILLLGMRCQICHFWLEVLSTHKFASNVPLLTYVPLWRFPFVIFILISNLKGLKSSNLVSWLKSAGTKYHIALQNSFKKSLKSGLEFFFSQVKVSVSRNSVYCN